MFASSSCCFYITCQTLFGFFFVGIISLLDNFRRLGVDQLKFRLQITTMELESLKMEADEQKRKHSEEINHLLGLIKLAYKERDEAREQLKMLINKLMPHPRSENPVATSVKANSSITESNSLSDAYNHHHSLGCSSPGDSFFDAVTSPDFSTWKIAADSCKMMGFGNQHNVPLVTNIDSATAIIDDIAKGRSLPQKRKLLQAVMEAGPLLQTLIVAGPLPRWRNPPPFQAFKIPSVSLTGVCDSKTHDAKSLANPNRTMAQKRVNQCSASMMNFASSGLSSTRMLNKGAGFDSPINISQTTKGFYDLTKRR